MSKRAKEVALERCPISSDAIKESRNQKKRALFCNGYEQAEKDLVLTIDDIELLHTFLYAAKNNKHGVFTFTRLSDEQYDEVLRRFQNYKAKKRK